jgi:pimeloyl-ACP methyl ester carboxylesterase
MPNPDVHAVLVPGAWMGAWIWGPTVERLRARGIDAGTLTLRGLEPGLDDAAIAAVTLEDHVQQLVDHVRELPGPVVFVSHSYSGTVTACAADRLGGAVAGLVHVGAFLPEDGRSLLDGWGGSEAERAQERADIDAAGGLWAAPTREMLDHEPGLNPEDRDFLTARFTPHPGRTVTDHARLSVPVSDQSSTSVELPEAGHWPMLAAPEATTDLLEKEIRRYTNG